MDWSKNTNQRLCRDSVIFKLQRLILVSIFKPILVLKVVYETEKDLLSEVAVFLSPADCSMMPKLMPEYKRNRDIVFSGQRCVTCK